MDELEKLWFVGVFGNKNIYCPWLFGIEPLEVVDGKLIKSVEYSRSIFDELPEELRRGKVVDKWMCGNNDYGYINAIYFSRDYNKIMDIVEGMRFCWDVLFASGKTGIENGSLTFENRDLRADYGSNE